MTTFEEIIARWDEIEPLLDGNDSKNVNAERVANLLDSKPNTIIKMLPFAKLCIDEKRKIEKELEMYKNHAIELATALQLIADDALQANASCIQSHVDNVTTGNLAMDSTSALQATTKECIQSDVISVASSVSNVDNVNALRDALRDALHGDYRDEIQSLLRTILDSKPAKEAKKTSGISPYREWTVALGSDGYYRIYRRINGKMVSKYIGKEWNATTADKIIDKYPVKQQDNVQPKDKQQDALL